MNRPVPKLFQFFTAQTQEGTGSNAVLPKKMDMHGRQIDLCDKSADKNASPQLLSDEAYGSSQQSEIPKNPVATVNKKVFLELPVK